ncbi:MAG: hypothetical protein PHF63_00070 [Herbinix sp.]|nr:hypothetical protein [Herbinix sp.]
MDSIFEKIITNTEVLQKFIETGVLALLVLIYTSATLLMIKKFLDSQKEAMDKFISTNEANSKKILNAIYILQEMIAKHNSYTCHQIEDAKKYYQRFMNNKK